MLSLPDQADSLALLLEHLGRGGRQVLFGHHEPGAGLQLDDVPRVGAEIDDALDGAEGRRLVGAGHAIDRRQPDLLGTDREAAGPAEDGPRDVAGEQVRRSDETRDEPGSRSFVDLGGRAELLDPAGVEDRQAVAHRERLLLVVGHVDERDADLLLDRLELDLHLLAQLQVERAQRLVEQQHARPVDERPSQRDALALAAGQLARLALVIAFQPDHAQGVLHARRDVRRALTLRTISPYATLSATLRWGNSA